LDAIHHQGLDHVNIEPIDRPCAISGNKQARGDCKDKKFDNRASIWRVAAILDDIAKVHVFYGVRQVMKSFFHPHCQCVNVVVGVDNGNF
tara:strand:- start:1139 stop:1408 length:270 start_codon:yes stop_codon:yes gene_type:complete